MGYAARSVTRVQTASGLRCAWLALACLLACTAEDEPSPDTDTVTAGAIAPAAGVGGEGGGGGGGGGAAAGTAAPVLDAGPAPVPDAGPSTPDAGPLAPALPESLAQTGLFASGSSGPLAPGVMAYAPRYALWADDADKERWLYLPEGTQIDTSDMDHWQFPVGTKAWKLFSRDGKKLETRLYWKREQGWFRMAFAWNDAETEALAAPDGTPDVRGTTHDVPKRGACDECHDGTPDRLLGVSAIQLSTEGPGMTLASLAAEGRLSEPPAASGYALGAGTEWEALGYLHANCGHCHNPNSVAYDRLDLDLWLRVDQLDAPESTESWTTTVDVALTETDDETLTLRVTPGDSDESGLVQRMLTRGSERAMPPLASEAVDDDGVAQVRAWIDALP